MSNMDQLERTRRIASGEEIGKAEVPEVVRANMRKHSHGGIVLDVSRVRCDELRGAVAMTTAGSIPSWVHPETIKGALYVALDEVAKHGLE